MSRKKATNSNQVVRKAVAENLRMMNTASYFSERKARADLPAFKRILKRKGGQPPIEGDEIR